MASSMASSMDSSTDSSKSWMKTRLVRRKKRRFKSLLHDLTKELITQYLATLVSTSTTSGPPRPSRLIVDEVGAEARGILIRPSYQFLTFLRARPIDPNDEDVLPRLLYRDCPARGQLPEESPLLSIKPGPGVITAESISNALMVMPPRAEIEKNKKLLPPKPPQKKDENTHNRKKDSPIEQALRLVTIGDAELAKKKSAPKPPKKYSEKMKAEASILQRIGELQKEGMWYDKRLPKVKEPDRRKTHWDYVLEEAMWMHMDFQQEQKWKQAAARKLSKAIRRHFNQQELLAQRALKEEEIRRRRVASYIAREIQKFWGNVKKVLELREQSRIEELKKKAMDQQLSFIVDQTEKYSDLLAEKFQSVLKQETSNDGSANVSDLESLPRTGISDGEFEPKSSSDDDEETIAKQERIECKRGADIDNELALLQEESQQTLDDLLDELPPGYIEDRLRAIEKETSQPVAGTSSKQESLGPGDDEFTLPSDYESDNEETIDKEEEKEKEDGEDDYNQEIKELQEENELDIKDLLAKYSGYADFQPPTEQMEVDEESEKSATTDVDDSEAENEDETESGSKIDTDSDESEGEEDTEVADLMKDENDVELATLLQTFAPERAADAEDDAALNSVAALAESFQPKGYTLSSTNVVTKVPPLIKHTLREYQHIGLDWLVTMCEKRLNGILADEMGLGKTIQTIALLAHLAFEKGNWGPHLIVVPTSVMLNWEMEFKKWCPGFKILTYYGSQKERKLKRTGWTKSNSFHVCITSYKLVIQDHQSFRRKRWKYLILDEAQNIKNFKSQRWQLLLNFNAQRRLLLTGTPLQNNLMELWSLMHFLMPNVFQSHREFREWFSNPVTGMVEGSSEYNENIIRRLHKVLRPFILRRLKSEVEKQLPKKYEHLVMCRLSKRQRFLYEEFMSRTRTRDTLNAGNLLSVINVLMQLRKVCNHPNLFEPRPVISPLQTEGINYVVPSLVWNMMDAVADMKPSYPIFKMTENDMYFSKEEGWRIGTLIPSFIEDDGIEDVELSKNKGLQMSSPGFAVCLKNKSTLKIFKDTEASPPFKRMKLSLFTKPPPPPMPRITTSINFFLTTVDPGGLFEDPDFVQHVSQGAPPPATLAWSPPLLNGDLRIIKEMPGNGSKLPKAEIKIETEILPVEEDKMMVDEEEEEKANLTSKPESKSESESECESESEDSDIEIIEVLKKRKVAVTYKHTGSTGLLKLGINPIEYELPEIQIRSLNNKKAVIAKLQRLNVFRCEINPVVGMGVVETCELFLPRNSGRRLRFGPKPKKSNVIARDFLNMGYFKLGCSEVECAVRNKLKASLPLLRNHPCLLREHTKTLAEMVLTLEERVEALKAVLKHYVIFIPAVAAPIPQCKVFRPSPSRYFKQLYLAKEMKDGLLEPSDIIHPVITSMSTQFPDPRLIQYDCGKLQVLDGLLRQLKAGSHRVLVFTQMARMLDVLEAFLNYHGYIYLRLDGATKIDQRQILMERFNTDKRIFCFILSTRSGGIGVNLTGADTVIFYDSDWNPTMDAQAQDRCHRIGQTRDVHIYRLVSEKTVEENILKKSNQKRMLGEIAIEGGNFTTAFFTKGTIHDLFQVDHNENDAHKRLAELTAESNSTEGLKRLTFERAKVEISSVTADIVNDSGISDEKAATQMLETAMMTAEDETDVQAARTVRAEATAELAEFDENISLDDLDNVPAPEELPKSEIEEIFDQLNPVELYAVKLMEHCLEDWTTETYANAQKDIEKQKQEWEEAQLKHLQELEDEKMEEDEDSEDEEVVTYCSIDAANKVWLAQNASTDIIMPIWCPPTPPQEENDVYMDSCYGYLYKKDLIPESQLPAVYVPPKHPKKQSTVGGPMKAGYDRPPEFPMDVSETEEPATSKKSPKVQRRDEPIFAPRSLFDRPTPALAKLRRDYRLQKYSCRPPVPPTKSTLGPGSISFPIIPPAAAKPPPPAPPDMVEWLISEDFALLQTVQNILELPLSLLVVNLAQTPNWDLAAEMVNMTSRTYRTAKQCKWRYENIVGPREEGKLYYDAPALSPSSPATKKKKTKAFIKIAPPSPSKASRYMKTSQLVVQDNNTQFSNMFTSKFETIKTLAIKRTPTNKTMTISTSMKSNKQSGIFTEHGINYENPLPATSIAQSRMERIQLERKKLMQQQQQQQQAAAAAAAGVVGGTIPPSVAQPASSISMALTGTVVQPGSPGSSSPASPTDATVKLTRGPYNPTVSTAGGLVPLVIGTSAAGGVISSGSGLPGVQKRQINLSQSQLHQQQYILQQKQLQSQQTPIQQTLTTTPQSQQQPTTLHVQGHTVMASQLPSNTQQLLRASQQQQSHPQTVVLTPGLAQAIGAAVGTTVSVASSGGTNVGVSNAIMTTATASQVTKNVTAAGHQQQLQRVATISMQDLTSSASIGTGQQQSPQTLVSLTPMTSQMTTKLIQTTQGIATLVQTGPRLTGTATLTPGTVQGNKMSNIQLQYVRQGGHIRQQTAPATATTASQQQAMQLKEQSQHQLKRIVVTSGSPGGNVGGTQGMTLSNVTVVPSSSIFTQATASPAISTASASVPQRVTGSLPVMTIGSTTALGTMATVMSQGNTRQVQLVKQQMIGGKTVTRAVSDADLAALLKQHGLTQQARLTVSNTPGVQGQAAQKTQMSFPVAGNHHALLTSVGLQNIMKVQPTSGGGQIATLVKSPGTQTGQQGGTLTFPLQLSQMKTVNKVTGAGVNKQVPMTTAFQQQLIMQRRQQQQQQQAATASKLTHLTQVSQGGTTQFVVQASPKQIQTGVGVPQFQPVFKQVTASSQVLQNQIVHAHVLAKPMAGSSNLIAVTSNAGPSSTIISGASQQQQSNLALPGSIVGPGQQQNLHARIVPVNTPGGVRQTFQVLASGPGQLLTPGTLARPQMPGATPSSAYQTIRVQSSGTPMGLQVQQPMVSMMREGQPVSIRLQSAGAGSGATDVGPVPGIITTLSVPTPGTGTSSVAGAALLMKDEVGIKSGISSTENSAASGPSQ